MTSPILLYTTVKLLHCWSKVGPYHILDKGIRWAASIWRSRCEHLGLGNPYNPTEIFKRRAMQMADLLIKPLRSYPCAGITPCLPSNPFLTKRILVNLFSSADMQLLMAFLEKIPSQVPSISIRFCFQAGQKVFRSSKNHSKAKMYVNGSVVPLSGSWLTNFFISIWSKVGLYYISLYVYTYIHIRIYICDLKHSWKLMNNEPCKNLQ